MKTRSLLLVVLALLLALGGAVVAQEGPVRVALVMPSSTTDLAWSQAMYDAVVAVQTEMGGESALEIAISENTWDVTAAADAMRGYAEDGYNIVIAHGTQYGTSLFDLAAEFPDTSFAWGTASDTGSAQGLTNVFAYDVRAQQGGYVNGCMAGLLTESGVIGVVGPVPAGDAILYNNGFEQGVYACNPDAQVLIAYTGSFGDTALAAETAATQIAAGADVLTGSAQQVPGAIDAIAAAGGYWFSTDVDQKEYWPETVVASMVYDFSGVISDIVAQRAAGVNGGIAYELIFGDGLTMSYNDALEGVSAEVWDAGMAAEADVVSGVIYPVASLPDSESPFRVAIVMPSTITDLAWSQSLYDALAKLQAMVGGADRFEIAYSEGMFDVTAAAETLRGYAEDGYDLVIAHGTQYGTSLFELAADYPETSFAWGTATDVGTEAGLSNIYAYEALAEQGGYINGVMAAMMSESGIIGIVGPVPGGDALLYINGFQQGVKATNPDAEILLAYTGSFGDTAKAAEVAQTQISAGADVLTGSAQQVPGAIDAIQAAGGLWFGTQSDQSGNWPETVVASQVYNLTPVVGSIMENVLRGELGGTAYALSLAEGGLEIVYGGVEVPDDVIAAADAAAAGIIAGDIVVAQELQE